MQFRCSVCRGQFEFDPDLKKDFIFCTHCGAQLQTKKPKARTTHGAAATALDTGDIAAGNYVEQYDPAKAEEEEMNTPIRPASATGFAAMGAPSALPSAPAYAPAKPVYGNQAPASFGAPMGGPPAGGSGGYGAPGGQRRPMRRKKKDNTALIIIIIVGALILIGGVVTVVIALSQDPPPPPPPTKKAPPRGPDPGELFADKVPAQQVKKPYKPGDAADTSGEGPAVPDPNEPK